MNISEKFGTYVYNESFQRVDNKHTLDLYIGKDLMHRNTLFLISESEPKHIYSSNIINIQIGKRNDESWGLSFILVDNKFEDLFFSFCDDIIESSRSINNKEHGAKFVCERYNSWQNMLSKSNNGLLSEAQIKGLIGELLFLSEILIPLYGEEKAIESWTGPEKTNQDFTNENCWYEVKSTYSGAESIRISSIEQLEVDIEGELCIVYLDKTSYSDCNKITLNIIYNKLVNNIISATCKSKFTGILLNYGYFERLEYDEYNYKFVKFERYFVNQNFPCIRRNMIPKSIVNSKYELSIFAIESFMKE